MTDRRRRRHRAPRTRVGIGALSTAGFATLVGALALAPHHAKAVALDVARPDPYTADATNAGNAPAPAPVPRPQIIIRHRDVGEGVTFEVAPSTPAPETTPTTPPTYARHTTPPTHATTHGSR